jgi:SAM-dependent methyltransferase
VTASGASGKEGKGAVRWRKRLKRRLRLARPYQVKRAGGAGARWELISSQLDDGDRSLLDVGSNIGSMTRLAADSGRFAVGVEPEAGLVRKARRRHADAPHLGFVRLGIDPESVQTLPAFDVVLCLSVHHYWVRTFGAEAAWRIVGGLLARARRKRFFEPASVKRKFGSPDLPFRDLDREAIAEYNTKRLEAVAAPGQAVRLLGETACRPREPFRMMFLVERAAARSDG